MLLSTKNELTISLQVGGGRERGGMTVNGVRTGAKADARRCNDGGGGAGGGDDDGNDEINDSGNKDDYNSQQTAMI